MERKLHLDPMTAFHEAGHALARYIVAPEMGFAPEDSIFCIESSTSRAQSSGEAVASAGNDVEATTFGPFLSKEMQDIFLRETDHTNFTKAFVVEFFERLRTQGRAPDMSRWLKARALIAVMGAAAEALAAETSAEEASMSGVLERASRLLDSPACDGDVRTFLDDCAVAGDTRRETVRLHLTAALARGLRLLSRPEIHSSLTMIAALLLRNGRASGEEVVRILALRIPR